MLRAALCTALLLASAFAFSQSLPVKSGLWENVIYDDNGKPSMTALNCFTPASFADMMTKMRSDKNCQITRQDITSKGMTVDVSCSSPRVQMTSHGVLEVVDSEHVKSTTNVKMTVQGKTKDSTMKADAHFKNANCGDVKPGDPKITS